MLKKKCKQCGTLYDLDHIGHCDICEDGITELDWLYSCNIHKDVIFLKKIKECPICELQEKIVKNNETNVLKAVKLKKASKFKATQKIKRPFKWEKKMPITKRQLNFLINLGVAKDSAMKLSKLEAAEKITELLR